MKKTSRHLQRIILFPGYTRHPWRALSLLSRHINPDGFQLGVLI